MARRETLTRLSFLTSEKQDRPNNAVYFVRITAFTPQIDDALKKCVEKAQHGGMLIDGKLASPDVNQISYYQKIIGDNFELNAQFISTVLLKWLPKLSLESRRCLTDAIYNMLIGLQKNGKNNNILKNAFTKYMCWIYYKFAQLAEKISSNNAPMIVYDGDISIYELQMLSILNTAGCDIVLLETRGDDAYLKLDPHSEISQFIKLPQGEAFPADYGLKKIVASLRPPRPAPQSHPQQPTTPDRAHSASVQTRPQQPQTRVQPVQATRPSPVPTPAPANAQPTAPRPLDLGPEPKLKLCTNTWQTSPDPLKSITTPFMSRSIEPGLLCNAYHCINGAQNPANYENELSCFYQSLIDSKRNVAIVEKSLEPPTMDEINKIQRGNYRFIEDMIKSMTINFALGVNVELQKYAVHAFAKVMLDEAKKPGMNVNKATNTAVYLLSWFKRWQSVLFSGWYAPATACFIFFGPVKKDKEILFLKLLSYMPVDVLILSPDLNDLFTLEDPRLVTTMNLNSLAIEHFPKDRRNVRVMTEACQAELELDGYLDADAATARRINKIKTFQLATASCELFDIWLQNIEDRPAYDISRGTVNVPVLFSKISGVEQMTEIDYWLSVKNYITPETYVIRNLPFITKSNYSPIGLHATDFYRKGKLLRDRIKSDKNYNYMFLRGELQDLILDKLEEILTQNLIRANAQTGGEYAIITAALSINKDICRMIQKMNYKHQAPKILVANSNESTGSLQDAVQFLLLNMIGFDILIFAPTGYQCVEQWYTKPFVDDHVQGDYQYNYTVPNFNTLEPPKQGFFSRLLGK